MNKQQLKKKVTIRDGECWAIGENSGYSVLVVDGKSQSAHKAFYRAFVGKVPRGKNLTNVCRHRWCVNPEHWTPKTPAEATRLGIKTRAASDTRGPIARWMDAQGLTSGDIAEVSGQSLAAAHSWRQGGWPNSEAEEKIRSKFASFPDRPRCEGSI